MEKDLVGVFLTSPMGAPVPNLDRVRSAVKGLQDRGIDAKAAYERYESYRPREWAKMPTFEEMMA